MTTSNDDCLFCKIVSGNLDTPLVAETEIAVAFNDRSPLAAHHVLIVPKRHIRSVADSAADDVILGVIQLARKVAVDRGLADTGYRLVVNSGPDAGQTVFHVHVHLLGGEALGGFGAVEG